MRVASVVKGSPMSLSSPARSLLVALLSAVPLLAACRSGEPASDATGAADTVADEGSAEADTSVLPDTATDTADDTVSVDTAPADTGGLDTDPADTGVEDTAPPDTGPDTGDDAEPDTATDTEPDTEPDTGADTEPADAGSDVTIPPDWIPSDCPDRELQVLEARDVASQCDRSSQCSTRLSPICPYAGGCHDFVTLDKNLTQLEAAYEGFVADECGDFVCRCAAPPQFGCYSGHCQACPDTCPTPCALDCACIQDACGCDLPLCAGTPSSCPGIETLLRQAVTDIATCRVDADCVVEASPACELLGCWTARNVTTGWSQVVTFGAAWDAASCGTASSAECDCGTPPTAACVEGRCQIR
jgi:hypothetical protein